jgi:hypothetical protein
MTVGLEMAAVLPPTVTREKFAGRFWAKRGTAVNRNSVRRVKRLCIGGKILVLRFNFSAVSINPRQVDKVSGKRQPNWVLGATKGLEKRHAGQFLVIDQNDNIYLYIDHVYEYTTTRIHSVGRYAPSLCNGSRKE